MGRTYELIDEGLAQFMATQPVFFVASAPSGDGGHVNCSPKGNDGNFLVMGPLQVAYQDGTGSGAETAAHMRQNGRIVLMFCAFSGPPRILRLHGRGRLALPGMPEWDELDGQFPPLLGRRAFVVVDVERISTSCGYGVPLMDFQAHRTNMDRWAEAKGPEGLTRYRAEKNALSLDGLPALPLPDVVGRPD